MPTTDEVLAELGEKLDKILAVLLVNNKDPDTQIRILRSLGYDWKFIAAATGLTAAAARKRKSRGNSGKSRKRKE